MKQRLVKCRWSHCKHGGQVSKDEAVSEGKMYYHQDCYNERKTINEIIKVYHERVDEHPIENFLRKTVNDLIFKDGNSADYLLFALKYCLDNNWTLHSPSGLRYVVKDFDAKRMWSKRGEGEVRKQLHNSLNEDINKIQTQDWIPPELKIVEVKNKKKVSNILGV